MAPASKRRKVATSRIERPRGVAEQFRQADVSGVQEISKIFEGKELCIINAPRELSKHEMERKIVEVNLNDSAYSVHKVTAGHWLISKQYTKMS